MVGKKNTSLSTRLGLILFMMILVVSITGCEKKDVDFSIGISQLIENPVLDLSREGFIKALSDKGYKDGENISINTQIAQGDISLATTIAQDFVNEDKDLIFAIATPSAQSALNSTKEIPILFTAVTDAKESGLVKILDKPEGNITGSVDLVPMIKQFELGKEFVPNARAVGIPYNNSEVNSQIQIEEAKIAGEKLGLEIVEIPINNSSELESALNAKIKDVDFLFLPSDSLIASSVSIVKKVSLENKIPAIGVDKPMLEKGALACEGLDYFELGYKTGLMAVDIIEGKTIGEIPVSHMEDTELIVNETMLEELGLSLPDSLKDAVMMREDD